MHSACLSALAVVQIQIQDGSTPLLIASHNGHVRVVELLLAKGAATNQADKVGPQEGELCFY